MTRKPPVVVIRNSAPESPAPREPSPLDRHDYTPKQKPNPLTVAQFWLGDRLRERNGCFVLDGVPARLEEVMRETNRVLRASGAEMIDVNPRWLPHE